uniref:purine-nucleoside phosphorylase n=1 Tax=Neogobius melanostomus TaxID=47308 RepID=A0A8C6WUP2_9GOBI
MHQNNQNIQDEYQKAADWLLAHTKHRPSMNTFGLRWKTPARLRADTFVLSPVQGHAGRLVFGELRGKTCVCMQGRFHMYEGHSLCKTTFPVRVFKLLGVDTLIVTNAAGSLDDSLRPGDIMILKDHINFPGLCGLNPLCGPNLDRFGPRFPAMSGCYDAGLRRIAMEIGKQLGVAEVMTEGVYAMVGGPNFESIAEARLLHRLGVDAVGMSTAPEVVVATHCGLRVFGLSLITNKVVKSYDDPEAVDHEAVLAVGRRRAQTLQSLVMELVSRLDINNNTESAVGEKCPSVILNLIVKSRTFM